MYENQTKYICGLQVSKILPTDSVLFWGLSVAVGVNLHILFE